MGGRHGQEVAGFFERLVLEPEDGESGLIAGRDNSNNSRTQAWPIIILCQRSRSDPSCLTVPYPISLSFGGMMQRKPSGSSPRVCN